VTGVGERLEPSLEERRGLIDVEKFELCGCHAVSL
jgi:hypothetical protein